MKGLDKISLYLRQLDAGSVSTAESRHLHRHFLSFKLRRNTSCKYHDVNILKFIQNALHIKSRLEVASELLLSLHILLEGVCVDSITCRKGIDLLVRHVHIFCEWMIWIRHRTMLVAQNAAATDIFHVRIVLTHCLKKGDSFLRYRIIVTPHHILIVSIWSYDSNPASRLQRKHTVVLKEGHGLIRHLKRQSLMFLTFNYIVRKMVPKRHSVHLSELESCKKKTEKVHIDLLFSYQASLYRLRKVCKRLTAFCVHTCLHSNCSSCCSIRTVSVSAWLIEIRQSPAV